MSAQATGFVWKYSPRSHSAAVRNVHLAIADVVNDGHDHEFFMRTEQLAIKSRCSRSTVVSALATLVEGGWLEVLREPSGARAGHYRFMFPDAAVVWETESERRSRQRRRASDQESVTGSGGGARDPRTQGPATSDQESVTADQPSDRESVASEPVALFGDRAPSDQGSRGCDQSPVAGGATGVRESRAELKNSTEHNANGACGAEVVALDDRRVSTGRDRDYLWEAVMDACAISGPIPPSARGAYNSAVGDLRGMGVSPAEVGPRAIAYRARFPKAALTPNALVRHWAECDPAQLLEQPSAPSGNRLALAQAVARREGRP